MRYYIIAGEASGDLHGSNLMRAILRQDPQAEFRFWGGDAMSAVGGKPVRHIRDHPARDGGPDAPVPHPGIRKRAPRVDKAVEALAGDTGTTITFN